MIFRGSKGGILAWIERHSRGRIQSPAQARLAIFGFFFILGIFLIVIFAALGSRGKSVNPPPELINRPQPTRDLSLPVPQRRRPRLP